MVGIRAFICLERSIEIVIIGSNLCSKLGFFQGIVNNLISVTNPATFWFVDLVRV